MNNQQVYQEIAILYELALATGKSLDLKENAAAFIKTFLSRKKFSYGSLWTVDLKNPSQTYHLAYAYPENLVGEKSLTWKENYNQLLNDYGMGSFVFDDPKYQALIKKRRVDKGVYLITKLGEVGVLKLYSASYTTPLAPVECRKLQKVFSKFSKNIEACWYHEKALIEAEERLKAKEALAIADNKYKNIIENLNEGLIITDKQGKITFMSKKMTEITGFTAKEALGKVAYQLFLSKEEWPTFAQKTKQRLEGKSERYEVEQLRKDGTTWYSVMNASPYWSPSGEIIGAITAITDITEQKKIEHLNEYNRALMQKIIDTALDAVVSFNRDNEITHWNNQAEVIFGYTKREAIGKNLSNLIVSEQFEKIQEHGVKDYLATGKGLIFNQRIEVTAKDRGGKEFPVELAVTPVTVKGEQLFSAFIRDISKQKEDQRTLATINQRFATLIENMQAGILLEDENRNIVLVNEKFCEMFRVLVEPSQMLGLDCAAITEESKNLFKDEQGFVEGISKIIQANQMVLAEEIETKDNRILERDYIPIHINEQYLGHLWQYRDVSEKQQQQRELVEAKNRAEEAVVAKQNFLSAMSHEVRTPMNAILGMNKLLAKTTLSTQQRKYTAAIQDAGEHLLVIINDILDTSKIEAGKIELEHIHFDVARLFDQLHLTLSHKAEEKGVGFFFELDKRIHPVLVGDPVRLNQVLVNLLSNAVKFTDRGQVRLYGKLVSRMPDINVVSFEVKDTGKGIAPDKLADIFNRFSQEDTSISRKYGGTGLGLSIARQLVELFGGELQVESKVGVGTTFSFIVAFKTGEKEALAKEEKSLQVYDLAGLRVLLVEDNPMNQLYAKTVLDDFSAYAIIAQDGTEAIK
ncbi:MAG: PAS domain S-box protein, partial [Thermonemataceae bacterium]